MHGSSDLGPEETDAIRKLISYKVQKFQRAAGRQVEHADLEQDLAVKVLERLNKFDPTRASFKTFVSRVLDTALVDLERQRLAQKRQSATAPISIDAPAGNDPENASLSQSLTDDQRYVSVTGAVRSSVDLADLRQDLRQILSEMPSHQSSLCELLMELTFTEAAQELGVHRGTLHRQWQAVMAAYEDHSLKQYFE